MAVLTDDEVEHISTIPLRSSRSIQEFRLDFLLEEELAVDPGFGATFLAKCGVEFDPNSSSLETFHSVSDKHGEADLIAVVSSGSADQPARVAVLIENKINASFQPRQAERYRLRGQAGIEAGHWDRYVTALVAPAAYMARGAIPDFDVKISIEELCHWLSDSDPLRKAFRIAKFQQAIAKKQATGVQVVDPEMTSFRRAFFEFLPSWNHEHGTDFSIPEPKDTWWDDNWFLITSGTTRYPSFLRLRYLSRTGRVSLDMKGVAASMVEPFHDMLGNDMHIVTGGRRKQHTSIQIVVEPIARFDSFVREEPTVRAALAAAKRLQDLFLTRRDFFRRLERSSAASYGR